MAVNTKHYNLSVEVPRNPGEYRLSDHARQRKKYRENPSIREWIICEVIEEGEVRGVGGESNRFVFEKDVELGHSGSHSFSVVVALEDDAFLGDGCHWIVSCYCECHKED